MRLMFDERVLVLNQKYDISDGKTDSLISVEIYNQKILNKLQAQLEFIGNQENVIITKSLNQEGNLNIIDINNDKFERLKRYYSTHQVDIAAYDAMNDNVAYVEGLVAMHLQVIFQQKNDYENTISYKIPESTKVLALFFEKGNLFAITGNEKTEQIAFHNLTASKSFNSPEYTTQYSNTSFIDVEISNCLLYTSPSPRD